MTESRDSAARVLGTTGTIRMATLINLAELVFFYMAAKSYDGPMDVFAWVLFGVSLLVTFIMIVVEIIALVTVKVLLAGEKLEDRKLTNQR